MSGQFPIPIAIVGISCRFPGGANDPEKLWSLLSEGRSAWSEVPSDRFNSESFYHPCPEANGALNHRGGHFLDQDIRCFDAGFFGIPPAEAHAMDPQQRIQLETAYEALENAGISLEQIRGSETAVYIAVFSRDYDRMQYKDTDDIAQYTLLGSGDAIVSNRISYTFDLKGPSMTLDTGCSGSLVALHQACQSLRTGESSMALVGGTNLILSPDAMITMSMLHILNPDGKSYAFDSRGSGYGRGEGVATVVLKRLDDALKAGDPIRSIIRHTGVNQDGRTNGITLPSQEAQQRLMRSTYQAIGLGPRDIGYFEAHGTGTIAGDVAEVGAIADVFLPADNRDAPLHLGSIKSNIGHLESSSGIAGLIKATLVLERGWIPPTIHLKDIKIDLRHHLRSINIPTELTRWPDTCGHIRRASVNSFGYGGTNAHAVLEQAPVKPHADLMDGVKVIPATCDSNYVKPLCEYSVVNVYEAATGYHSPKLPTDNRSEASHTNGTAVTLSSCGTDGALLRAQGLMKHPQLLVLTAHSEASLISMTQNIMKWASLQGRSDCSLKDLAHTLSSRRSIMKWRCSLIATTCQQLISKVKLQPPKARKALNDIRVIYIFTGQGSQWFAMGRELIYTDTKFRESLNKSDEILQGLGAAWNVVEELLLDVFKSRIYQSRIAQPATTALQIALVDLLRALGVRPIAVLGHSSGEIAAAYAAGVLSHAEALKVAYYRSFVSDLCAGASSTKGAMLAVGLGEVEIVRHLSNIQNGDVCIACVNSPTSVTISGDEAAIDELKEQLDTISVFNRKLPVDTAYHSHHMRNVADEYLRTLDGLSWNYPRTGITFISSVTASEKRSQFGPSYWVENLVSKVRFSEALGELCYRLHKCAQDESSNTLYALLEIGPHSGLSGPVRHTITALKLDTFNFVYASTLVRDRDAVSTLLELSGLMFEYGYGIKLDVANSLSGSKQPVNVIHDLPPYPWNHSAKYWHESRLSKDYRLRAHPHHDLLGLRIQSGNDNEPTWRNTISVDRLPWLRHHVVDNLIILPGTFYLCMAIEGIHQIDVDRGTTRPISRFVIKEIVLSKALVIPESPSNIEIQLSLRSPEEAHSASHKSWENFQVSCLAQDGTWHRHCHGLIKVEHNQLADEVETRSEETLANIEQRDLLRRMKEECSHAIIPEELYHGFQMNGNSYGSNFKIIKDLHTCNGQAVGSIQVPDIAACMPSAFMQPHILHPATFDSLFHINIVLYHGSCGLGSVMPVYIDEVIVSVAVASQPGTELVVTAALVPAGPRSATANVTGFQSSRHLEWDPVITITGCEFRCLGETERPAANEPNMTYQLDWGSDVDVLTSKEIRCSRPRHENELHGMSPEQRNDTLNRAAIYYINTCLNRLTSSALQVSEKHYVHLLRWMTKFASSKEGQDLLNGLGESQVRGVLQDLKRVGALGDMLSRMGEHLTSMLTGRLDPLSLMLQDGLLYRVYNEDSSLKCSSYLTNFIKSLSFKKPLMTVLEIGAGTGGTTLPLLQALGRSNSLSFERYDFTDISSGFFEPARALLQEWSGFIRFKKLDIEQDPIHQGFQEGSYDLLIASNVLHATSPMDVTVEHARKLLKPGGRLAFIEATKLPPFCNITFGLLPGWWKGINDGRSDSPLLSIEQWDAVLKRGSFTGVDIAVNDYESSAQKCTMMVSRNLKEEQWQVRDPIGICSLNDDGFSHTLSTYLRERGFKTASVTWTSLSVSKDIIYVMLDCGDKPILVDPSNEEFARITLLLTQGKRVLWVTTPRKYKRVENPEKGLITGLVRVARSENEAIEVVTLSIEKRMDDDESKLLKGVTDVLCKSFCLSKSPDELEYTWKNGQLEIPRLTPNVKANNFIKSATSEPRTVTGLFNNLSRPLKLLVAKPGLLDSMVFVDDELAKTPLRPDELKVQAKAYGINFKDVFLALGQMKGSVRMAGECAGVVTAVGSELQSRFQIGDRVCALNSTPYASHPRVRGSSTHHILDTVSFTTAASIPVVFLTAYYGLIEVARLSSGQKVLIHAASGGVGQASIQIAQDVGAEIFATAGSVTKRQMLIERYGIPRSNVFSSRSTVFKQSILRLTQGQGMDVILNSLSGEVLQDTWDCIARFGTFLEIGKSEIFQNRKISMKPFDRNVNFSSIDLAILADHRPNIVQTVFAKVMTMFNEGRLTPANPITILPIGDIENAFRLIQARKHTGKVVLQVEDDSIVKAAPIKRPQLQLSANGTYLVAGGQGDLGKRIIQFMFNHGAKYFVVLSRRGLDPSEQRLYEHEMITAGAKISVMACDIADFPSVEKVIACIKKNMPPIKGVIQAAMVLQDCILEQLSAEDFKRASHPKTLGTSNLAEALKDLSFDFFIMLSSCCSILGHNAQANYAAGNAYQDALANSDTYTNAHYMSLNLGMIEGSAVINSERRPALVRAGCIPVKIDELFTLLKYALSAQARKDDCRQIAMGFDRQSISDQQRLCILTNPMFSHLPYAVDRTSSMPNAPAVIEIDAAILATTSIIEVHNIITAAISKKITALISLGHDEISSEDPMLSLGLDSLIAIELKNWIVHAFHASLQTSEILDSQNIKALATTVANRSALVINCSWRNQIEGDQNDALKQHSTASAPVKLPTMPLPKTLAESLSQYVEAVRCFCTQEDLQRLYNVIEHFQEPKGPGQELQRRLIARTKDPELDDWHSDLFTVGEWTTRRVPINPWGHSFGTYPNSGIHHTQARQAAIISNAAFHFKKRLEAGEVKQDYMNEQPLCMDLCQWTFNSFLEPGLGVDNIRKVLGKDYLVALRNGHIFTINLDAVQTYSHLESQFESVLSRSTISIPSVATLTADVRDSWAKVRGVVKAVGHANQALLHTIEAAAFVICLDDALPTNTNERVNQFLISGPSNRWSDKSLQFVVCKNGVAAWITEHAMLDGDTLNQLHEAIIEALAQSEFIEQQTLGASGIDIQHTPEEHSFVITPDIQTHINRVTQLFHSTVAPVEYALHSYPYFGSTFLRAHKLAPKTAFQIIIQLASRLYFGTVDRCYEPCSLRPFHRGRLDWIQTTIPPVAAFLTAASDNLPTPATACRALFLDAAKALASLTTRSARGKGFQNHLRALRMVVREGEELPQLFRDPTMALLQPGAIFTDCLEWRGLVREAGFHRMGEGKVWVHYEVGPEGCQMAIKGPVGRTGIFYEAIEEAAGMVRSFLEGGGGDG